LPVQMEPEGGAEATAAVALNAKAWGTEVVMRCRYQGTKDWVSPVYTLVAKGVDGSDTELARWTAIPDKDVVLAAATDLTRQQLAGLEVHDARGDVVLRTVHI
ncbi:MAG: hypothetical protein QOD04_3478, partial [Pseudonocardiales bacterium]|nr:hypothetical protein [Pseudonocardiales bacterium]